MEASLGTLHAHAGQDLNIGTDTHLYRHGMSMDTAKTSPQLRLTSPMAHWLLAEGGGWPYPLPAPPRMPRLPAHRSGHGKGRRL